MGQSTDGILFWGYCLDEEGAIPGIDDDDGEHDIDDWEDIYAASTGIHRPGVGYGPDTKEMFVEYWEKRRAAVATGGCRIGTHCSGDYPMYYVAVGASRTVAYSGYPKRILDIDVGDDWREKLDAFCRVLGITPDHEPGWWLVSYVG